MKTMRQVNEAWQARLADLGFAVSLKGAAYIRCMCSGIVPDGIDSDLWREAKKVVASVVSQHGDHGVLVPSDMGGL